MNVCIKYKMESKEKLKVIDLKNHACYYFNDGTNDINISDILLHEKLYEDVSV